MLLQEISLPRKAKIVSQWLSYINGDGYSTGPSNAHILATDCSTAGMITLGRTHCKSKDSDYRLVCSTCRLKDFHLNGPHILAGSSLLSTSAFFLNENAIIFTMSLCSQYHKRNSNTSVWIPLSQTCPFFDELGKPSY